MIRSFDKLRMKNNKADREKIIVMLSRPLGRVETSKEQARESQRLGRMAHSAFARQEYKYHLY